MSKQFSFLKWLLLPFSLSLLLGLLAWRFVWRSPPYYTSYGAIALRVPPMTSKHYEQVIESHARPYIVHLETPSAGAVFLYGSEHTQDPADAQIPDLKERWRTFRPTVALVESRLGFLVEGLMDPVQHYGEMGAVFALARQEAVPAYTWEPNREQEVQWMLQDFPNEQVALFYVLRPYFGTVRFGKPENPDELVEQFIRERTRYPGLQNILKDAAHIDALWRRDFPGEADWRDKSDYDGFPGYLGEIADRSNEIRDEHFVKALIDLVQKGHRVFAVAGSSHAVKLEPALRAVFGD